MEGETLTETKSTRRAYFFSDHLRTAESYAVFASEDGPIKRLLAKCDAIKNFHNYVAPVTIDGVKYYVRFTVQEIVDGRSQIHSAFVSDAEIVEADNLSAPISNISTSAGGQKVGLDHKLRDWWHSVNPDSVSKVVDENGEPRVVYHGTSQEFDAFDMGRGEMGSHFSSVEGVAVVMSENKRVCRCT